MSTRKKQFPAAPAVTLPLAMLLLATLLLAGGAPL
jgi:hypothetical protein